jgi:hypothetical protein
MNREKFLQAVRRGGEKFRVDSIVIASDKGELRGKGVLSISAGAFAIQVNLDEESPLVGLPYGAHVRRDFWMIQGKIEDKIAFSTRGLPTGLARNQDFGQKPRSILEFSENRLELMPAGFDCLTSQEIFRMQQQVNGQTAADEALSHNSAAPRNIKVTFRAVLPDFKLIEHNAGTETINKNPFLGESSQSSLDTFHGEMNGWEYGLVERDGDLHVYLVSKPEHQSLGEDHDWQLFNAFMNTLAFAHAQHAWPFSVEYRRDGKLLTDRIQLNAEVADSPHAPFNRALAFNNATKNLSWKFADAIEKGVTFFNNDMQLAHEVENLLYIFREATAKGIPKRIALLSLCSLLESLVRAVYEEEVAPKRAAQNSEFQKIKKEICEELTRRNQPGYDRLSAILANAEPLNARMRFEAVIEHLDLKPREKWQELFELWQKFRNPMSHRMSKSNKSDDLANEELFAESRIAGAINCMILKLMKYSGYVNFSVFEDVYAQI